MVRRLRLSLLTTTGLVALAAFPRLSHSADPIMLTLGGYYSAAAGFTTTGNHNNDGEPNHDVQPYAFKQNVEVYFNGKTTLDNGLTAGVHIELEGNNEPDRVIDELYAYFRGGWGEVRFGDTYGPLVGACVVDPGYITNNFGLISPNNSFTNVGSHAAVGLGSIGTCEDTGQKGSKAGYVSPVFSGFQFAVSYAPNSNKSAGPTTGTASTHDLARNIFEGYARYIHDFGVVNVTAGLGGEWTLSSPTGHDPPQFYQAGLQLGIGPLTVGASGEFWRHYVNAGLADTGANNPISENSNAWMVTAGAAYAMPPWTFGLELAHAAFEIADSHDVDHYNAVSLQTTYELGPGIVLEGEVAWFSYVEDQQLSKGNPRSTAHSMSVGIGTAITF